MKDMMIDEFQYTIQDLLVTNKSILDLITKFQESNARINRGIVKSITQCGCINIDTKQHFFSDDCDSEDIKDTLHSHQEGTLCENCTDIIERDIGRNLFYLAAVCNTLDLNIYDILIKELDRIKMLGKYNLR